MRDFRMSDQILRHGHDGRYGRLVISAQQRRAVCQHQILPDIIVQIREVGYLHDYLLCFIQNDILSLIVFQHPGLYIRSGCVRCRIHMGNQSQCLYFMIHIGRDLPVYHAALFIQPHIRCTDLLQFGFQHAGKIKLLHCCRYGIGMIAGLCVYFCIADQTVSDLFIELCHYLYSSLISGC